MIRVVFTDLDGTLLGHHDYRWDAARPALAALEARGIPLVLASSKTSAEMRAWRDRFGNRDPWISENGGAVWIPEGTFATPPADARARDGVLAVEIGAPYATLRAALAAIARETGLALRGFGDMDLDEIVALTGLDRGDAALAQRRDHDEPFVAEADAGGWARIAAAASARGLRITGGGRFRHLTGDNDKGRAARRLAERYAAERGGVATLALGDGANDAELLAAADRAAIIARPDGRHAPELCAARPDAARSRAPAPEGFAEIVLGWLADTDAAVKPQG